MPLEQWFSMGGTSTGQEGEEVMENHGLPDFPYKEMQTVIITHQQISHGVIIDPPVQNRGSTLIP